ncbi:C6 zinc finger protein [Colletotrichum orchidophilum]|uniref:C6 zinc finger protein n=1 Tax=Colletotrichum orchidophilum TaxID=1209926 RepID=A0A1G4ATR8_9PEZI|nr:C6 zinc finger protein [Colletotrichum orchidophilum]OHE92569.1 C6 zinc finger protein [Colletotrichum orchidophilum]
MHDVVPLESPIATEPDRTRYPTIANHEGGLERDRPESNINRMHGGEGTHEQKWLLLRDIATRISPNAETSPTESSPPAPAPAPASAPRKRGRPRKDWDAVPKLPTPTASGPSFLPSDLPAALNPDDLEVLHHYMCHTAITLGEAGVWRQNVPRLGFQHHYVLHMVLAISAQHLARLRPAEAPRCEALTEQLPTSALPAIMNLVPRLDKDNSQALYHIAVLVCLSTFAKKPSPGQLLVTPEDCEVPWCGMLRGVHIVVQNMGIHTIIAGWADDSVSFRHTWTHCPPLPNPVPKMVIWERRLEELADLVATIPAPEREMYTSSLDLLKDCFK